jgi:hypothetical protein
MTTINYKSQQYEILNKTKSIDSLSISPISISMAIDDYFVEAELRFTIVPVNLFFKFILRLH